MATFASAVSSSVSKSRFLIKCPLRSPGSSLLRSPNRKPCCKSFKRLVIAGFKMPDDAKARFKVLRERLWQSVPDSAKALEWKKAEDVLLQQLLSQGREALLWSFIAWFGLSFASDAIYSISMNKELLMPVGVLAGCLLADFVKETSLEFFHHSESGDLKRHLVGIGTFCVLLKSISLLLPVQVRVLLLHVANGGLLQVLWLWRSSLDINQCTG